MLLFSGIDRHSKNICKRVVGAESRLGRKSAPVDEFQTKELVHLALNDAEMEALKSKSPKNKISVQGFSGSSRQLQASDHQPKNYIKPTP